MFFLPFEVDFDITMDCMYKCKHCNVSAGKKLKDELTLEQIKNILDQLDEIGVSDLSITGGEPLLRKDCLEILKYASNKEGFRLTLNTNGLLLTENVISFLEKNCPNINIAISLDGYNAETYSILRKSYLDPNKILIDEFKMVMDNLKIISKSKLSVGINYTITQKSISNFWKTYDLIRSIGLKWMLAIKFFPYGRGEKYREELELRYDEWSTFLETVMENKLHNDYYRGIQVSVTCPWEIYLPMLKKGYTQEQIHTILEYNSPLESELYKKFRNLGCHAGITSCAISPNGDVYPCGTISSKFPPFVCGNLKQTSFLEIWEKSDVLNSLRNLDIKDIEGKCTSCKFVELCGGGCRGRAFTEYNSLVAKDYLCPLNCENSN